MVDLGFLLITFFIFTTTMGQPKTLNLIMPDDTGAGMPIKESGVLTILLGSNNSIYYYEGNLDNESSNLHSATAKQIREAIIDKKRKTAEEDFFIIIKPGKTSVYKDIVNVLDEMTINDIKKYALANITDEEERIVGIEEEKVR